MKFLKTFYESIRNQYSKMGVDSYYSNHNIDYINPHEDRVKKCLAWVESKIDIGYFLDMSCGNGEVSNYLLDNGYDNFKGSDPYFYNIYKKRFDRECFNLKFEDISKNSLPENFDTILCSYALHLCDKSYYNNLLWNIASNCNFFVVISPSKYPNIDAYFELVDSTIIDRTHCKIYRNIN